MPRKLEYLVRPWLLIVLAMLVPHTVRAIVVLERGSNQPIMGYLVRESSESLVIRQELPDGPAREVTVPKSRIEELIVTVAPERLAALDPVRPQEYREYAEELAEKRRDPEARDAARRLLTIAAHRGDDELRHSALLGLVSLAKSADEERRLRALAYLHDPRRDESIFQPPQQRTGERTDDGSAELASALRLIRQGKAAAANSILEQPRVKHRLSAGDLPVAPGDVAALAATTSLSDKQLAMVLRAELALEATGQRHVGGGARWSLSDPRGLAPMPLLKLENLTEFNPAECLYRDSRWTRP